jgi:hypothetical protein
MLDAGNHLPPIACNPNQKTERRENLKNNVGHAGIVLVLARRVPRERKPRSRDGDTGRGDASADAELIRNELGLTKRA